MKTIKLLSLVSLLALFIAPATTLQANIRMPRVFSSNMVLQRDMPVPIWGWAESGEKVTVSFAGQKKNAVADNDGKWIVKLDAMPASKESREMTIVGKNKIVFSGVLVGEVWVCSGQSNMVWPISKSLNAKQEMADANYPFIRRIYFIQTESIVPMENVKGTSWGICCTPKAKGYWTAVGFHFAKALFNELDVPIGIISSYWGGTRIEPWIPLDGFAAEPELAEIYDKYKKLDSTTQEGERTYKEYVEKVKKWVAAAEKALDEKKQVPASPPGLDAGTDRQTPTKLFNGMINPMVPYAIRGVIWYQGEFNGDEGDSYYYKMKALITSWRHAWKQGDFPFYYAQLANYKYPNTKNPEGGDGWANLREAQLKSLNIPKTGMAVAIDVGEKDNIHPKNKQDVGKRLARWALANDYGKDVVPSGPLYKNYQVEGDKIRISFDYVGSGLMVGKKNGLAPTEEVDNGKLKWFAIKDKDGKWYWADAKIDGGTVVVSSEQVKEPVAVRYAFTMNPEGANLYNKEGLPASPFKTDNKFK